MTALRQTSPISQYTPSEPAPETGSVELRPAFDLPLVRELIQPDHALWTPTELRDLTGLLASELGDPLGEIVEVGRARRWWARLGLTAGVEVWLLSWAPGQGTEPHDHGGASGSFAVLFGDLDEDYRYPAGPIRHARHGPGSAIGFGTGRAHRVHNGGELDSASVHAYSPPLLPVRHYAHLADVPPPPQHDVDDADSSTREHE